MDINVLELMKAGKTQEEIAAMVAKEMTQAAQIIEAEKVPSTLVGRIEVGKVTIEDGVNVLFMALKNNYPNIAKAIDIGLVNEKDFSAVETIKQMYDVVDVMVGREIAELENATPVASAKPTRGLRTAVGTVDEDTAAIRAFLDGLKNS